MILVSFLSFGKLYCYLNKRREIYKKVQWLMAGSWVHKSPLYRTGKLMFSFMNHHGKFPPDQAGTTDFTYSADSSDSKCIAD